MLNHGPQNAQEPVTKRAVASRLLRWYRGYLCRHAPRQTRLEAKSQEVLLQLKAWVQGYSSEAHGFSEAQGLRRVQWVNEFEPLVVIVWCGSKTYAAFSRAVMFGVGKGSDLGISRVYIDNFWDSLDWYIRIQYSMLHLSCIMVVHSHPQHLQQRASQVVRQIVFQHVC